MKQKAKVVEGSLESRIQRAREARRLLVEEELPYNVIWKICGYESAAQMADEWDKISAYLTKTPSSTKV
ncbi:MAG: helix-turn-helix transcriptional regulator [Bacteroidales bacterium]|nr:helix-turn-helix transcriptional regulator [Bacteroidales bacterium]